MRTAVLGFPCRMSSRTLNNAIKLRFPVKFVGHAKRVRYQRSQKDLVLLKYLTDRPPLRGQIQEETK